MMHYTLAIDPRYALSLKEKMLNWKPRRQVDLSYFIGDSALQRVLRADKSHVEEKPIDIVGTEFGVLDHDI